MFPWIMILEKLDWSLKSQKNWMLYSLENPDTNTTVLDNHNWQDSAWLTSWEASAKTKAGTIDLSEAK